VFSRLLAAAVLMIAFFSSAQTAQAISMSDLAGHYTGSFQTNMFGLEGYADFWVDSRGRVTGYISNEDIGVIAVSGTVKINKRTGAARGSANMRGGSIKGTGTVNMEEDWVWGTFTIKAGGVTETGSYEAEKD